MSHICKKKLLKRSLKNLQQMSNAIVHEEYDSDSGDHSSGDDSDDSKVFPTEFARTSDLTDGDDDDDGGCDNNATTDIFNTNFASTDEEKDGDGVTGFDTTDDTTPFDDDTDETTPFDETVVSGDVPEFEYVTAELRGETVPSGTTFSLVTDLGDHYVTSGVRLIANVPGHNYELGRFGLTHRLSSELAPLCRETYEYFMGTQTVQAPPVKLKNAVNMKNWATTLLGHYTKGISLVEILQTKVTFTVASQAGIPENIDLPEKTGLDLLGVKFESKEKCELPVFDMEYMDIQFKLARRSTGCTLVETKVTGERLTWGQLHTHARDMYMDKFATVVPWDIYVLMLASQYTTVDAFDISKCKTERQSVLSHINYVV